MRYIVLLLFPLFSCDDTKLIDVERLNTFEGYHNHFMQQRLSKITITDHISGNYEEMNWEWESWLNATVFRTTNGSRDLYKQLLYNEYGYLMCEKEYWDGSFCQQNLFDAWKVLSNVCVDNGDTLIQDYNWGVDRLTVIGPNGRKRYNDYGLVVGIYDEILSSWVNNDISENGRRYLTERDILDCNGKRIIIEKNKWTWENDVAVILGDPVLSDSCQVLGYLTKKETRFDRFYHVLEVGDYQRNDQNSEWVHQKQTTTNYDYSHPFKGIQ